MGYTAFTSAKKGQQITARLIVRRVRDLTKQAAGQGKLFPAWRYHDWTDGPLAHLPSSGSFAANAAWTACAAIAHNLLRAAGSLASLAAGKARGATIRRDLIDVAARTARHWAARTTARPDGLRSAVRDFGPSSKRLTQRFRSPHRNPTSPAAAAFAHRFPTDKTAFPGTRRHTC